MAFLCGPGETSLLLENTSLGVSHAAAVQDSEGDRRICRRSEAFDVCWRIRRQRGQGEEGRGEGRVEQLAADDRGAGHVEPRRHCQRCR